MSGWDEMSGIGKFFVLPLAIFSSVGLIVLIVIGFLYPESVLPPVVPLPPGSPRACLLLWLGIC